MTADDKNQFAQTMEFLGVHFPDRKITPAIVEAYYTAMKDYSIDSIQKMAMSYVKTGRSFPYVADLLREGGK